MRVVDEFKEFIARGNVMDMAVGIIVGGAFTGIVNSLVNDIIPPVIQLVTGGNSLAPSLVVAGINFGGFIGQVINFLIVAFVLFTLIKFMNKAASLGKKPKEEEAPTTKECPYCKSEISIEATRCPNCTSYLP